MFCTLDAGFLLSPWVGQVVEVASRYLENLAGGGVRPHIFVG